MKGLRRLPTKKLFRVVLSICIYLILLFSIIISVKAVTIEGEFEYDSPRVISTLPSDGETNVNVSQKVIVEFSEKMNSDVTPTLIQKEGTDPGNWVFKGWSLNYKIATWSHNNWQYEENITLTVSNYESVFGEIGETYYWSFSTEKDDEEGDKGSREDTSSPYVESTTPYNNEEDVEPNEIIIVNFNEEMNTVNPPTLEQIEGDVPELWSFKGWDNNNTSAVWNHGNWTYNQNIKLKITNYSDISRNKGESYIWSFTINSTGDDSPPPITGGDSTPPEINKTIPKNYGSEEEIELNVSVNQTVIVLFNEPMNKQTLELNQIQGFDPEGWEGPIWCDNDTVAIWYHNNWDYSELITLKISNYSDKSGNFGENFTWSFKTENDTSEGKRSNNNQPKIPQNGRPNQNSTLQNASVTLEVFVEDPDGDYLNVSFYDSEETLIGFDSDVESGTIASVNWNDLNCNTSYSWYAISNDSINCSFKSSVWFFTTKNCGENPEEDNPSTGKPSTPSPSNNAEEIELNIDLQWQNTDGAENNNVTYAVYFKGPCKSDEEYELLLNEIEIDIENNNFLQNSSSNTYNIDQVLDYNSTYIWKIIAWDNGSSTSGGLWKFTTKKQITESENPDQNNSDEEDNNSSNEVTESDETEEETTETSNENQESNEDQHTEKTVTSENVETVETEEGKKYLHIFNISSKLLDGLDPNTLYVTDKEGNKYKAELVEEKNGYYTFKALTDESDKSIFAIDGEKITDKQNPYNKSTEGLFSNLSWEAITSLILIAMTVLGVFLFKSKSIYLKKDD